MEKTLANYIIYNNRSKDLVKENLPILNIKALLEAENKYAFILNSYKSIYNEEILESELNLDHTDIIFQKKELADIELTSIYNTIEYDFLINRGISNYIIDKYHLSSLSNCKLTNRELDIIGFNLHPLISDLFENDKSGVIIPLYDTNGCLENLAIRRMNNSSLKYTLAIPDISVWNLDKVKQNDEIWITEGLFDMMALSENVKDVVISVSSASWSTIQLVRVLEKNPRKINIFSDYDYTGLRTSVMLKRFFNLYDIEVTIYISKMCKDSSEHFFKNNYDIDSIEEIYPSDELLELLKPDISEIKGNFLHYLKNRII